MAISIIIKDISAVSSLQNRIRKSSLNVDDFKGKVYIIKSNILLQKGIERSSPFISKLPTGLNSIFIKFKEELNIMSGKYDYLFFASKRIEEIKKWGSKVNWDIQIQEYKKLIFLYWSNIPENEKQYKIGEFKYTLAQHKKNLETYINNSGLDSKSEVAKLNEVENLFAEINFQSQIQGYKLDRFCLDLSEIIENKDFGIYKFYSLSNSDLSDLSLNTFKYQLGGIQNQYEPQKQKKNNQDNLKIIFPNIPITVNSVKCLDLTVPVFTLLPSNSKWEIVYPIASSSKYIYKTNFKTPLIGSTKHRVSIYSKTNLKFRIIKNISENSDQKKSELEIYSRTLFAKKSVQNIEVDIPLSYSQASVNYSMVLESNLPINDLTLSSIKIESSSLAPNQFVAEKISALRKWGDKSQSYYINYKLLFLEVDSLNTSVYEDKIVTNALDYRWKIYKTSKTIEGTNIKTKYQLLNILLLINLIIITFSFFFRYQNLPIILQCKNLLVGLSDLLCHTLDKIYKKYLLILKKTKLFFLSVTIIYFITNILIIQDHLFLFDLLILLFWVSACIGYKLKIHINYLIAICLCISCGFALLANQEVLAEQFGRWVYYFLMTGTVCEFLKKVIIGFKTYNK
jgi:hypothetical protein